MKVLSRRRLFILSLICNQPCVKYTVVANVHILTLGSVVARNVQLNQTTVVTASTVDMVGQEGT